MLLLMITLKAEAFTLIVLQWELMKVLLSHSLIVKLTLKAILNFFHGETMKKDSWVMDKKTLIGRESSTCQRVWALKSSYLKYLVDRIIRLLFQVITCFNYLETGYVFSFGSNKEG